MKNTTKKFLSSFALAIASILFVFLITPKNVSADADKSSIADKWLVTMFAQCLNAGPNSPLSSETLSGTLTDATFSNVGTNMNLPTFDYLGMGISSMNCTQVLRGASSMEGVFPKNGISANVGWDTSVLRKMGYKKTENDEVYEFSIVVNSTTRGFQAERDWSVATATEVVPKYMDPIFFSDDEDYYYDENTYESTKITAKRLPDGRLNYSYNGGNFMNDIKISFSGSNLVVSVNDGCDSLGLGSTSDGQFTFPLQNNIDDFYSQINALNGKEIAVDCIWSSDDARQVGSRTTYNFGTNSTIIKEDLGGEFAYSSDTSTVLKNFNLSISDLTEDEKYDLYVFYLNHAVDITSANRITCEDKEGFREVHLKDDDGKWRKYYINTQNVMANDFAIKGSTGIMQGDLNTLISWFNQHPVEEFTEEEIEKCIEEGEGIPPDMAIDKITPNRYGGDEDYDGPCFDGGVGSLGWIICPIIRLLRQTTENLYDYVITPFLEIDVGAFDTGSAMFKGWQIFQSFANIVFVIVLLLVILSQVTGYGIDNYGIKRMLPKIIVGAVLVNLSFIICQLLVDASNVIGFSMENMFDGLASQAMAEAGGAAVGNNGTAIGATIISGAVGIGGAAAAIYTAEIWLPVIILPLILGLISIIISCLFMFVILGARQAAAVILVVISPLAFVCYMLPNTKKLFDRWISAFKAILLLFPICGLLMGGGGFAGAILWNVAGDFFLGQLLAALITVIPFFFIPRILKASLSAVGNIGAMLSNAGAGISRGLGGIAKGAVGNSDWYNNLQNNRKDILEERNRNREQARAQRIVDRLKARSGGDDDNLTEAQRRRKYIAQAKLNKLQREDVEAEAGLEPISRDVELAQAMAKRRQESVSAREDQIRISPEANNLDSLQNQLTEAITGGDAVGIEALQNVLSGKGDKGREAVHQAMVEAEKTGNVSDEARQAYSSNIVNSKFANEYKNNARSTFDYAMNNTGKTPGGNMAQFYGGSVGSLTQQKMVDMDEGELKRVIAKMESGTMTDENYATVQRIARGALGNDKLQQSLKTSQRNLLDDIAGRPAQRTTSVDIQHNNAPGSGSNSGGSTA